jgi:C-terminal processing protease CtpA/Prc
MSITHAERVAVFGKVKETVANRYFPPNFNGKNWNNIAEQHKQAILGAESHGEFESRVDAMLHELDRRMILLSERTKIISSNAINASFRNVDIPQLGGQRWVFQDVAKGGPADKAGAKVGDILRSISGVQIEPPKQPEFVMGKSYDVEVLRGDEQQPVNFLLNLPTPKYAENPYAEPRNVVCSRTPEGIACVRISLFPGAVGVDFANEVSHVFEGELEGCNRLLVDLRGNPGGGIGGLRLMSYFTPEKLPVGYSLDRKTAQRGTPKDQLTQFGRVPDRKWKLYLLAFKFQFGLRQSVAVVTEGLGPKPFHGRIVILVDEHTAGAAEMVTQFARENGLAKIVGMRTAGRLITRKALKVGNRYRLALPIASYQSWAGNQIDGSGIQPDVEVGWSFEDARKGLDVQLGVALDVLKAM